MQDAQWFYADAQQQQQGPVSFQQIQMLAAGGQIQSTTLIWHDGMASWTAAGQVDGVFNAPAQAASAPTPGGAANPYAAPASGMPMDGGLASMTAGDYPIPFVKKCSFPLFFVFYLIGIIILIAAIVMMISSMTNIVEQSKAYDTQSQTIEEMENFKNTSTEEVESLAKSMIGFGFAILFGGAFMLVAAIFSLIFLHRGWQVLQAGGTKTTPGKAVLWLILPFVVIFVLAVGIGASGGNASSGSGMILIIPAIVFYAAVFIAWWGWAREWNKLRARHANLANFPGVPAGIFLALAIITPVSGLLSNLQISPALQGILSIGSAICFVLCVFFVCRVVNTFARTSQFPTQQGSNLPQMY